MASAFWGGFADTIKGRMDAEFSADLESKKQRARLELEREFAKELVDSSQTKIVGNEEVTYNKYGEEIRRRPLSPQELEQIDLGVRKTRAEVGKSEKELAVFDEDRNWERDYKNRELGIRGRGLDLQEARLNRADKDDMLRERDNVIALFMEAGDIGDNSAMAMLGRYDMEYQAATTDEQRRAVIAKYLGQARERLNTVRARLQRESRAGNSMFGLDNPAFGPVPPSR